MKLRTKEFRQKSQECGTTENMDDKVTRIKHGRRKDISEEKT